MLYKVYYLLSLLYYNCLQFGSLFRPNDELKAHLEIMLESNEIEFYKWLDVNGVEYNIDDIVLINIKNGVPNFGRIDSLIVPSNLTLIFESL